LPLDPRTSILDATIEALRGEPIDSRRVVRLRLTNYFSVVQLDDLSVGAAMNYGYRPATLLGAIQRALEAATTHDPLLLSATSAEADLLLLSLRVAIVSALSAPILKAGGDSRFATSRSAPAYLFEGVTSALVIGFGGYMDGLARAHAVRTLHVADMQYPKRRSEMDDAVSRYRAERPDLQMTISDGSDTARRMSGADLVAISGSSLCNGSLDQLLRDSASCPRVVVQGQSAAIFPVELFRRGVHVVSTTIKPSNLLDLPPADLLRTLEGELPAIYLTPRRPDSPNPAR